MFLDFWSDFLQSRYHNSKIYPGVVSNYTLDLNVNNTNIEAVLHLINGDKIKYVPAMSQRLIQSDLLIGIRQFKKSVRWREFWLKHEERSENILRKWKGRICFDKGGIVTKSRYKSKNSMKGSDELESFWTKNRKDLLDIGWGSEIPDRK